MGAVLRTRLLSPLRSDQAPYRVLSLRVTILACSCAWLRHARSREAAKRLQFGVVMMNRLNALTTTFVRIMESAGFQQTGREPAEAIELDTAEVLSIVDTLIRRLNMRTGPDVPILPVTIEDSPTDRAEWFAIVMQTCGEADIFFQRNRQAPPKEESCGIWLFQRSAQTSR